MAINNYYTGEGKNLDYQKEYADNLIIELAILKQDIILPTKIVDGVEKPDFDNYENMVGYFYIPIIMALLNNTDPTAVEVKAPTTKKVLNKSLSSGGYTSKNFLDLVIPRYIVLNFRYKIPAETKFLVAFVGGKTTVSNISIIGLYGYDL